MGIIVYFYSAWLCGLVAASHGRSLTTHSTRSSFTISLFRSDFKKGANMVSLTKLLFPWYLPVMSQIPRSRFLSHTATPMNLRLAKYWLKLGEKPSAIFFGDFFSFF